MDKWAELRTAFQVAKYGTVSQAAEVLGIHRVTVNRHIDILESEMGSRIFIRHARGYTLTKFGEDVLLVSQKTEDLIEDLVGRGRGAREKITGEIKVTIISTFTKMLIAPIAAFRAENPNCLVSIDVSLEMARLEFAEAHIAVRNGPKPDHPDYVVIELSPIGYNLYAHESYIQRKGLPKTKEDFWEHDFIVLEEQPSKVPFLPWYKENLEPQQIAVSSKDLDVTMESVLAGQGIGFLTDVQVAGRAKLHPVFPQNKDWLTKTWLVTHRDIHRTEKIQAMIKCIRQYDQRDLAASDQGLV